MKYVMIIRRDTNKMSDEELPMRLEFDEKDMEMMLTAAEAILLKADVSPHVFIERI